MKNELFFIGFHKVPRPTETGPLQLSHLDSHFYLPTYLPALWLFLKLHSFSAVFIGRIDWQAPLVTAQCSL